MRRGVSRLGCRGVAVKVMLYEVRKDGETFGHMSDYDQAVAYAKGIAEKDHFVEIIVCVGYAYRSGEYAERPSFPMWRRFMETASHQQEFDRGNDKA